MKEPVCRRVPKTQMQIGGFAGDYLKAITRHWLLVAPKANPGMLEMFRDRDRSPLREMVPWAGEFSGKYLTGAVQVLRTTADPALKGMAEGFRPHPCQPSRYRRLSRSVAKAAPSNELQFCGTAHVGHLGALPQHDGAAALA